jgi:hypothetical protein
VLHFAGPGVVLGLFLMWNELTSAGGTSAPRFRVLLRLMAPFGATKKRQGLHPDPGPAGPS